MKNLVVLESGKAIMTVPVEQVDHIRVINRCGADIAFLEMLEDPTYCFAKIGKRPLSKTGPALLIAVDENGACISYVINSVDVAIVFQ